jgi:thermostable 8-oxoguanine DNA glycosylase
MKLLRKLKPKPLSKAQALKLIEAKEKAYRIAKELDSSPIELDLYIIELAKQGLIKL